MSSLASARSVPPPTQQEVTRKLSVHSVARPARLSQRTSTSGPNAPVSGTESDSDSVFIPEVISPSGLPGGITHVVGSLTQPPPLQSIAERRNGSGEESDEDEEDEEGGWRVETVEQARGSHDETVLKTGYLWKKGERRKTWKKRWFVLRPAHLAFYKTSAEYKLLRLLDISEIHSCTPVQLKKHSNTFGMVSPKRTFYLQADSPQEVSEWVKAISDARESLLATSTQNSASAPIPIPKSTSQGRHSSHQAAPASLSMSHSPYNHHLTSSESEDGSPSVPRSYQNANTTAPYDIASPSKHPGTIDTSKVILSGYLMKCGSRRHIWHNRWFVLTGDKLVYSRSHMDTKPHRSIPLAQILDALEYELPAPRHNLTQPQVSPPPTNGIDEVEGTASKHTFKIVTTKRTLLLSAPSEEEEIKWLSAVRALIARRSVVPGDSAAVPHPQQLQQPTQVQTQHSQSLPLPQSQPSQNQNQSQSHGHSTTALTPSSYSSVPAPRVSASVPIPSAEHNASSGGSSSGTGTSPPGHKRRDSIARRLSLSGGGHFLSSTSPPTTTAVGNNGGGGGSGAISQDA